MTLPTGLTAVEVRGTYINVDGSPAKGTVTLTPAMTRDSPSLDLTIVAAPVKVILDEFGRFACQVAAGDDPDLGILYLKVEERIGRIPRPYTILVPESAAETGLHLSDAEKLEPVPDMAGYVLVSSVGQAGGVTPLGIDGNVPDEFLPATTTGSAEQVRVTGIAGTALSGQRIVTKLANASIGYASNNVLAHVHAPLWVTFGAAVVGDMVEVLAYGALEEPSWNWVPGEPLFLGLGGVLVQTPPTAPGALFLAQIGVATTITTIFINRQSSIIII